MSSIETDSDGNPVDDRVAELIARLKDETNADRVLCHWYETSRVGYWSKTQRVRGTVVDVAQEEGFRLEHATTRDGQGYAELVPMGDPDERVDHDNRIVTDGGYDQFERLADAQERQADALELIAGMLMLYYNSDPDQPEYTVEALESEARFYAEGGPL